eukprot:3095489-Rhodomonas_salina.1
MMTGSPPASEQVEGFMERTATSPLAAHTPPLSSKSLSHSHSAAAALPADESECSGHAMHACSVVAPALSKYVPAIAPKRCQPPRTCTCIPSHKSSKIQSTVTRECAARAGPGERGRVTFRTLVALLAAELLLEGARPAEHARLLVLLRAPPARGSDRALQLRGRQLQRHQLRVQRRNPLPLQQRRDLRGLRRRRQHRGGVVDGEERAPAARRHQAHGRKVEGEDEGEGAGGVGLGLRGERGSEAQRRLQLHHRLRLPGARPL